MNTLRSSANSECKKRLWVGGGRRKRVYCGRVSWDFIGRNYKGADR